MTPTQKCDKKTHLLSKSNVGNWVKFKGIDKGKIVYMYCSKSSVLPIRDILGEHGEGNKKEPNYETKTYNYYNPCNTPQVKSAIHNKINYLFFVTRYTGTISGYRNRYFIMGYYKIDKYKEVKGRYAVYSDNPKFVNIESAFELNDKIWRRWFNTSFPDHGRHIKKNLDEQQTKEILDFFRNKKNYIKEYIEEIKKLFKNNKKFFRSSI